MRFVAKQVKVTSNWPREWTWRKASVLLHSSNNKEYARRWKKDDKDRVQILGYNQCEQAASEEIHYFASAFRT